MGTVTTLIIPKYSFFSILHMKLSSGIWHELSVKRICGSHLAGPGHTKAALRSGSALRDVHRHQKFPLQCMVWNPWIRKITKHVLSWQNIRKQLRAEPWAKCCETIETSVLCRDRAVSAVGSGDSWAALPHDPLGGEMSWWSCQSSVPALHTSQPCPCLQRGSALWCWLQKNIFKCIPESESIFVRRSV